MAGRAERMATYYLSIKLFHIACVALSGSLFALRGVLVLCGRRVGNHVALHWLSYTIDTCLLTSALMLVGIVHQYPFVHGWLTVKVLLLVVYVALGILALRRAATVRGRLFAFLGALLVFAFIVSVARAHHPLGVLTPLFG